MYNDNVESSNPNLWLAEYAKILGVPKKELLVLAANNDPFNCGTPAQIEAAEWFEYVYNTVGYTASAIIIDPSQDISISV